MINLINIDFLSLIGTQGISGSGPGPIGDGYVDESGNQYVDDIGAFYVGN